MISFMDTGFVDVSYKAFDDCRTQVHKASQELNLSAVFALIPSGMPADVTDPKIFGLLAEANNVAVLMDTTWAGIRTELTSGQGKLNLVERALDEVETNLRKAETASGA
jgi:cystathionine beta-lyase/cystathionine gamma-synthase